MILNTRRRATVLLAALCGLFFCLDTYAQTFVRYVTSNDLSAKTLYADSVLTSVALPKGVSSLDDVEAVHKAASDLVDVLNDENQELLRVYVCGSASPDGLWQENVKLSEARTDAAVRYIRHVTGIPADKIHKHSLNEDWDRLYELVEASDIPYKNETLEIIRTKSWGERKLALQQLGGGTVWKILLKDFFPLMRCVRIGIYCKWDPSKPYLSAPKPVIEEPEEPMTIKDTVLSPAELAKKPNVIYIRDTVYVVRETVYLPVDYAHHAAYGNYAQRKTYQPRVPVYHDTPWMMAFKTNLLADAMAIPSLGMEIQLAERMSLDLQGWYTGTNMFCREDVNTNVYGFTPELRWWTGSRAMRKGTFIGVHARMAWYTLQWTDGFLYQNGEEGAHIGDAGSSSPAWSVGFTYGYSMPLDRKDRWGLELLLGLGYGKYAQNVGEWNEADRMWNFTEHQDNTHIGITRASINLTYRFSVRKVKPEYYNSK